MKNNEPKVTLISHTANPIQTVYRLWLESKDNKPVPSAEEIDPNDPKVLDIFQKVIDSHIPVSDAVSFVFMLENISVSFREQMVRHRVGMSFGPRVGVDIVPDIGNSSWWGQSMRILDMGSFASEGRYRVPESLAGKFVETEIHNCYDSAIYSPATIPVEAATVYREAMLQIEEVYNKLIKAGVPREDARDLIPLGATHRFSWTINLTALKHVIGKRSCWIPQIGLWKPIIFGIVEELATKIHPSFRNLVTPPCIKGDKFVDCVYKIDNERRISGEDETVPCPMYLEHHAPDLVNTNGRTVEESMIEMLGEARASLFFSMSYDYSMFWMRNPWSGEKSKS
jgi:thymidylate synthase ThyX